MKRLAHKFTVHRDLYRDAELWCKQQWGPRQDLRNRQGIWSVFWAGPRESYQHYVFHFATKQQLAWFLLRWS